jgi:hypothetical protein
MAAAARARAEARFDDNGLLKDPEEAIRAIAGA